MIDACTIERAKAVAIEYEIDRRGIRLRGRVERSGPCPRCGGIDRFSINTRKQIWNCRGCHHGGDVIALLQHLDGCTFADAIQTLTGNAPERPREYANLARQPDKEGNDEARRLELAHKLFEQADPLGPEAVAYFDRRGININSAPMQAGLRWHPACPFDGKRRPCLLARYTDAISNMPRGIWRRPIDGSKPKALGPTAGSVIRLWLDEAVTLGLVLGEGVETTLAAATRIEHRSTLLQPAWAAGFAANMATFPALCGINVLTLLVDNDESGAGQRAADECAARWRKAGKEVIRLTPTNQGEDFNNVVKQ